MPPDDEQRPKGRPDYKVYRSRPRLSDKLRKGGGDLGSLRKKGDKRGPEMRKYRSGGGGAASSTAFAGAAAGAAAGRGGSGCSTPAASGS